MDKRSAEAKNRRAKTDKGTAQLSALDPRYAGLDIGASEIFVAIAKKNGIEHEVKSFLTFTADLRSMVRWLQDSGVKSVAMESTGVYWIPAYEMLEAAGFEVLLVNTRSLKYVPGRKSDVQDCQWIQQLHSYGLLRASFRPTQEIVQLRAYARQRAELFTAAAERVQLMHKALTQMNIQLSRVLSDIVGLSGLNIIRAILNGNRDPHALAQLTIKQLSSKREQIAKALDGNYREEHIFALGQAYEAYEFFHKQVIDCEKRIEQALQLLQKAAPSVTPSADTKSCGSKYRRGKTIANRNPFHFDVNTPVSTVFGVDLTEIPGIDGVSATKLLAELGTDMTKWPTVKAFCSWLGLCPGNKISGGKILSSKTRPGNNRAAQVLRMAAASLIRSESALGAFLRRMRSRLGAPKAITATAHKLARMIYQMLRHQVSYKEAGGTYYEEQYRHRVIANLSKRAKELGCTLMVPA